MESRGNSIATYHEFVSGLLLKVGAGPLGLTMMEKLPPAMFDKSSSIASGQAFASLHPTPTMKYSPGGGSAWEVVRPLGALGMAVSDCAISDKFEPSDTLPRRQVSHRKHPALREQLSVPILRSCLFLNLYSEDDDDKHDTPGDDRPHSKFKRPPPDSEHDPWYDGGLDPWGGSADVLPRPSKSGRTRISAEHVHSPDEVLCRRGAAQ